MLLLLAYDDGRFAQVEESELEPEVIQQHNDGEVTILALHKGRFCTAAVDHKEHGLEIVDWNPV